jgi:hypothetical protein
MHRPRVGPEFVSEQARMVVALLRQRAAVPREELEYLVERVERLRDPRLQAAVVGLIGWGDEERAEIETFIAISIEVMRRSTVSRIREAARIVELRYLMEASGGERTERN